MHWLQSPSKLGQDICTFDNCTDRSAREYLCYLVNHPTINEIMKRKKYPAKKLEEFNPNDYKVAFGETCYGLNVGMGTEKICIRLRLDGQFLPHDTIMTTMIHELTHMDVSDHGPRFIAKQEELRTMYNQLNPLQPITKDDSIAINGYMIGLVWILVMIACMIQSYMMNSGSTQFL